MCIIRFVSEALFERFRVICHARGTFVTNAITTIVAHFEGVQPFSSRLAQTYSTKPWRNPVRLVVPSQSINVAGHVHVVARHRASMVTPRHSLT